MKIAALYTCYNRKDQTLSSIRCLYNSVNKYNLVATDKAVVNIYLTDDGCTDGTAVAIRKEYSDKDITILHGNGNLFWNGGMLLAWKEALKKHSEWDYYLLLNDDTDILEICFEELMATHKYCLETYNTEGVYSGVTCAKSNPSVVTYGGDIILNKLTAKFKRLQLADHPQLVDKTNANILLVPKTVVDKIGIFYEGYRHGTADSDYAAVARKKGIPVLITSKACGLCDNDHGSRAELANKIISMSLKQRKAYFAHPLHSSADKLLYTRRHFPLRYPMQWIYRKINEYFPKFYYRILDRVR